MERQYEHLLDTTICDFTHYDGLECFNGLNIGCPLSLTVEGDKVGVLVDRDNLESLFAENRKIPKYLQENNETNPETKTKQLGVLHEDAVKHLIKYIKMGHNDIFDVLVSWKNGSTSDANERVGIAIRIKRIQAPTPGGGEMNGQ